MAHLHGWIHIEDFACDNQEFEQQLEELIKLPVVVERHIMNAVHAINLFSCHNHYGLVEEKVVSFFFAISKLVDSESYGLLYIYDDEGREGHPDRFQVYRLAKNHISQPSDPFFSPYSEQIADFSEDE